MAHTLKTSILQAGRSSFIIELVKHETGKQYVDLKQIVHASNGAGSVSSVKLNPRMLGDLIKELTILQQEIAPEVPVIQKKTFSEEQKAEMIRRYLIGVDIPALAIQFNCKENLITETLQDASIEIVSNKIPYISFRRYNRKKK